MDNEDGAEGWEQKSLTEEAIGPFWRMGLIVFWVESFLP